jgi:multicomponent Na+:H+ antiporter subunit B
VKRPFGSPVLDAAVRILVPFLMIFAIYVLSHGHYSPGGGFQAGAILAISLILVPLVEGPERRFGLGKKAAVVFASLGTFMFAAIGLLPLFFGGNLFDYGRIPLGLAEPEMRALATVGIETGVALAVMGVFVIFFDLFETGI